MKKFFKIFLIILSSLIVLYNIALFLLPSINLYKPYYQTIYESNGKTAYNIREQQFTTYTTSDQISPQITSTLVGIEDQRFYEHRGIDYLRIFKSAYENIKAMKIKQGGSTLTQQLARIIYLSNEKSFNRKIKEILLAKKIERYYSKQEIIELYLNSCYFGENIYGINQACKFFFNKEPNQINYKEASILVGTLNAPNFYSPYVNIEKSLSKANSILNILYQRKIISKDELEENINYLPTFTFNNHFSNDSYLLYFQDAINEEMKILGLSKKENYRQGLKIISTLNQNVNQIVINSINKFKNYFSKDQVAVVVMKPYSGEVMSLIGGSSYYETSFNRALHSKRQIGSTIKPLLYYLALESGMDPLTKLYSEKTSFYIKDVGEYSPENSSKKYANRQISMIEALGLSDNIYATKTALILGSEKIASFINRFGIDITNINPTIALGSNEMTPLELTSIYNCFASEGYYYKPHFIKEISTENGQTIYKHSKSKNYFLNHDSTIMMNYMLRAPFDKSLASYTNPSLSYYQTKKTFSAKTGSTSSSSWVIGFNPLYTIGIYVGNDNGDKIYYASLAKQLFQEISDNLMDRQNDVFYLVPSTLKSFRLYNSENGKTSFTYLRKK